jgi:hypothetical protein
MRLRDHQFAEARFGQQRHERERDLHHRSAAPPLEERHIAHKLDHVAQA